MTFVSSIGSLVLYVALLGAGVFLPGWLLGLVLRTPTKPFLAFVGSCALLFNLVLALDACGIALTRTNVSIALAVLCALLAFTAYTRRSTDETSVPRGTGVPPMSRIHQFLLLLAGLGLAAIALKAVYDPLSGFDQTFRWDFLARQMLRETSLDFYPPISEDDFLRYGWCDGIAPLISTLYFWAYASLGRAHAMATAPLVIAQAAFLFVATHQLARRRGGAVAGCAATALLATSSALLWGIAIGQETGVTALCLVLMFLCIENEADAPGAHWLAWAGLAAGTGALAREYGLAFIPLGALALAWRRTPRRGWVEFGLAAALVAAPWYLRNVVVTGHPLYSYDFGGLFPANPVHVDYMHAIADLRAPGTAVATFPLLLISLAGLAGVPLVLGVIGGGRSRQNFPWLLALLAMVALWFWSIKQTAGGLTYSHRMLTPALALGAVLGGQWLAPICETRRGVWVAALLALLALDASVRSLYLPVRETVQWWREPANLWLEFSRDGERWRTQPWWTAIAEAAGPRKILVPDPTCHAVFASLGGKPVPHFSPAVRFLFDPHANFGDCLERLRRAGLKFIITTRVSDITERHTAPLPFFRALYSIPPVGTASVYSIYDLDSPSLHDAARRR